MTHRFEFITIVALVVVTAVAATDLPAADRDEASEIIIPRSGLVLANVSQRRRQNDIYDPIEALMVLEGLADYHPQAGQSVKLPADETRSWEPVELGENGDIGRQAFSRGGYLYVPVTSESDRIMMLNAAGHGSLFFNGQPHTGNIYGYGYFHVPVFVRKGTNSLLLKSARGTLRAQLYKPAGPAILLTGDKTLPDLVVGEPTDTWGAVIVANASREPASELSIVAAGEGLRRTVTQLPTIPAMSIRKVGFRLQGFSPVEERTLSGTLELRGPDEAALHSIPLALRVRGPHAARKVTFVSQIDGSVQYYGLRQAKPLRAGDPPPAIVLSLHGASVEAIGQASSYSSKSWLHLVAPTNRRPYGFDWEDFGRADAMEVLSLAKNALPHDPSRVYLTGHSMGGHGTWHVGSLFPDTFAAVGPSAGWISYRSYALRQNQDDEAESALRRLLRRGETIGNPIELADNFKSQAVYVLHGDDDNSVPVGQARRMSEILQEIHRDWSLHEEPGKGHWWSNELDDGGATCMDWPRMYDLFARHAIPPSHAVRNVEFSTANPGVSNRCHWLVIEGQHDHHAVSKVNVHTWPNKRRFQGTTRNVSLLRLDVQHLMSPGPITVELDGQRLENLAYPDVTQGLWLKRDQDRWQVVEQPPRRNKGSHRYGAMKNELKHRFLFVYGTQGSDEENRWMVAKANLDAETYWYRGNASVDVIADGQFEPSEYADRTIVLFGNADTNSAWNKLLSESPVKVRRGHLAVGDRTWERVDLAAWFIQPRQDSEIASVVAIGATGPAGMRLACKQSLFIPFVRYPDCVVYSTKGLETGRPDVKVAGYFGADWSVEHGEFLWENDADDAAEPVGDPGPAAERSNE